MHKKRVILQVRTNSHKLFAINYTVMRLFKSFVQVLIILSLFESCTSSESKEIETDSTRMSSIPPTEVTIVRAAIKPFEYFITASGKISSAAEVRSQFKRSGIIQRVTVTNGQRVKKGDLLAVLDNVKQELALAKARLLLQEKKIIYDDMMLSYQRSRDSTRFNSINTNIRISSGLAAAEIAFEEAKIEYENSFVRAQIGGVVSTIEINAGSPVSEASLLCYIYDTDNLIVNAEVLEADALQLKKGMMAEIRPTAVANELYKAKVENINPRVEDKTGLVKVTLGLTDRSHVFPGMHVQATIRLPFEQQIIVPKEAIVIRSGKHVVFTYKNMLAKWNYVTIGRDNGKEVEILEGLQQADSVIVTNNLQLAHDATVKILKN